MVDVQYPYTCQKPEAHHPKGRLHYSLTPLHLVLTLGCSQMVNSSHNEERPNRLSLLGGYYFVPQGKKCNFIATRIDCSVIGYAGLLQKPA